MASPKTQIKLAQIKGTASKAIQTDGSGNAEASTVTSTELAMLAAANLDTDISAVAGTDTTLASAKAIKTYVDAQVTAADLDLQGDSGTIDIDLDSETLDIAGGTNITTAASGTTLTVNLDATVNIATELQTPLISFTDGDDAITIADTGLCTFPQIATFTSAIDANSTSNFQGLMTVQTGIVPDAQDGAYLGTSSLQWSDLFMADEAMIAFGDDNEITLSHIQDTGLIIDGAHANGTNFKINNQAADGDARVEFQLSGTTAWSMGVDDGDADKFVIEDGSGALGADPAFEMASDKSAKFYGALDVVGASTMAAITSDGAISTTSTLNADGVVTLGATGVMTTINGTFNVDEAATFDTTLDVTGDTSVSTFDSTGATSLATGGGVVLIASPGVMTTVEGTLNVDEAATFDTTLGVTGITTLTAALNANGGIACDTNKFTVADTSGNVATAGTLGVTGIGTFTAQSVHTGGIQSGGDILSDTDGTDDLGSTGVRWANVWSDAVTITDNTSIGGTLGVTGVGTFTAQSVHTGGIQSGGNILSDTDGTDDLGSTGVRWANVWSDAATITNNATVGGTLGVTGISTFTAAIDANSTSNFQGAMVLQSTLSVGGALSMNGQKITSLGTPTADTDAATKVYVDGVAQGLDIKDSVLSSTEAELPAGAYNAGVYTVTANGPLANQDGIVMVGGAEGTGSRLLVKDQPGATAAVFRLDIGNGSDQSSLPANNDDIRITLKNSDPGSSAAILDVLFLTTDTNPEVAFSANGGNGNARLRVYTHSNRDNTTQLVADRIRTALNTLVGAAVNNTQIGGYSIGAVGGSGDNERTILITATTAEAVTYDIVYSEPVGAANIAQGSNTNAIASKKLQNGIYYVSTKGQNAIAAVKAKLSYTLGKSGNDANIPQNKDDFSMNFPASKQLNVKFKTAQKAGLQLEIGGGSNTGEVPGNGIVTITMKGDGAEGTVTAKLKFATAFAGSPSATAFVDREEDAGSADTAGTVWLHVDTDHANTNTISEVATIIRDAFNTLRNSQVNGAQIGTYAQPQAPSGSGNGPYKISLEANVNNTTHDFTYTEAGSIANIAGTAFAGVVAGGTIGDGNATPANARFLAHGKPSGTAEMHLYVDHTSTNNMEEIAGCIRGGLLDLETTAVNGVSLADWDVSVLGGGAGARTFNIEADTAVATTYDMSGTENDVNQTIALATVVGVTASAANQAVLTRAKDANAAGELSPGAFVFIEQGSTNADSGWVMSSDTSYDFGAHNTEVTFSQFSGAGSIEAGAAMTKSGNRLDVAVDGSTIEVNADALRLKDAGITLAKMAVNSIDSDQYIDGSIDLAHMSANSIDSAQYVDGSIDLAHMSADSVDSAQYVDGSIDLAHMSADSIDSAQYVDASIDTAHIADDQITNALMADDAIDSAQLVAGSVDLAHMSANSIDSAQYVDGSIDTAHFAAGAVDAAAMGANSVDSSELVDGSVDLSHMSDNSIDSDQYVDGSIDTAHFAAGAVDAAAMGANSVDSSELVDGSVDLSHMSANSVDSPQYVDGSIDLIHMSVNSIDSDQYVDGSIDLIHMSANSVDSDQYVDASIDTAHIGNLQITTALLAADAVDGTKLADDAIDSEHYTNGSIDTAHIAADQITSALIADDQIDSEHYVDASIDLAHMSANSVDSPQYVDASIDAEHLAASVIIASKVKRIRGIAQMNGNDTEIVHADIDKYLQNSNIANCHATSATKTQTHCNEVNASGGLEVWLNGQRLLVDPNAGAGFGSGDFGDNYDCKMALSSAADDTFAIKLNGSLVENGDIIEFSCVAFS